MRSEIKMPVRKGLNGTSMPARIVSNSVNEYLGTDDDQDDGDNSTETDAHAVEPELPKKIRRKTSNPSNGQRSSADGPWCWANKSALNKIRSRCEDSKSILGVYWALCECASDERSDDFTISLDRIGAKCGMTRKTVAKWLYELERIGLIDVLRSKTSQHFRIPSAYVLLRCETTAQA